MSLFLKVEVIAGTTEEDAATALVALAERTGIMVEVEHNEIMMRARPNQSADDVLLEFKRDQRLANYPTPS